MNPDTTTDSLDLSWSDWYSLNPTDGELSTIPTTAGLYRIRHHHRSGLEYIGQTGRSLRGRIGALARNTYNEEMPYRDSHTAAPCLWAIRQEDGPAFSVSYVVPPNASTDTNRKGLEAALIAIHRKETGESPTANFGRIIPGYRQSSYRRDGRIGGPLSDDQFEPNTELGVEPLTWVHYQELDHPRWMGLNWTEWQSLPEAQVAAPTDNGLYRIKTTTDEILTYIGQSGNLRSRLRAHTKTYSEDHMVQFAVRPELDARHKREEIETELIGAHYLFTGEPPRNQF